MPAASDAAREGRVIKVRTCQTCPFAHLEIGSFLTRYCAVDSKRPEVSDYYSRGKLPAFCPLLRADYRTTADVIFSTPA